MRQSVVGRQSAVGNEARQSAVGSRQSNVRLAPFELILATTALFLYPIADCRLPTAGGNAHVA